MNIDKQTVAVRSLDNMIAASEERQDTKAAIQFRIQRDAIINAALARMAVNSEAIEN